MPLSPAARRRRVLVRALAGVTAFAVLVAGGALGVSALLRGLDGEAPTTVRCSATVDGTAWYLEPDQAETAALLAGTAVQRGMPARAVTIAIATALQESKMRNIDYGDRDSVGLFQQRPSQGWGTVEQIMDPVYSTGAFYDALDGVDGYEEMEVTVAAQTVQRSGFPDAYAQHEARARAWASALAGHSPGALTCELPEAEADDVDPAALLARLERDLGATGEATHDRVVVDLTSLEQLEAAPERARWTVAQWAVATADAFGVVAVRAGEQEWTRDDPTWSTPEEPTAAGEVVLELAGG